jgi:hypothetical protein
MRPCLLLSFLLAVLFESSLSGGLWRCVETEEAMEDAVDVKESESAEEAY